MRSLIGSLKVLRELGAGLWRHGGANIGHILRAFQPPLQRLFWFYGELAQLVRAADS
jgi:hypothetical protein